MKINIDRKTLTMLIFGIVTLGLFIYIRREFTFNFVALFIFLILFMLIPFLLKGPRIIDRKNPQTLRTTRQFAPDRSPNEYKPQLLLLVASILVFGTMALYALGNYFNPVKEIYKNYEHHALKVEGLKISDGFYVAGRNNNAFLDNSTIAGTVKVVGHDIDSVYLELSGLTNPLYRKHYVDGDLTYTCLNSSSIVDFEADKWVTLSGYDTDDNIRSIKFKIVEGHEDGFLGRDKDTVRCFFIEEGRADTLESTFTRFLKSGYPLEGLAADISTKFDLRGINVVRGTINPQIKRKDLYDKYSNRKYYIELQSDAYLQSISIEDETPVLVSGLRSAKTSVSIPYKTPIFIGTGENISEKVCFGLHPADSCLTILFELPKYQKLSSREHAREASLMVTTSITNADESDEGKSGLIENLTDNVLLFDFFHEKRNKCNIDPFFLSYVSGPTNELMEFSLMSETSQSTEYGIKTDTYFPDIKSRAGNEWLIKVENFKEKTPFKSTKLVWILLVVILLSAMSLLYSEYLYTGFEYVCYLLIIAFLAVRFFLLWRITVFPPLTSISKYEFNHFMSDRWLNITLIGIVLFFLIVNVFKRFILNQKCSPDDIMSSVRKNGIISYIFAFGEWCFKVLWEVAIFLPRTIVKTIANVADYFDSKRGVRWRRERISMTPRTEGFVGGIVLMLLFDVIVLFVAKLSSSPVITVLGSVFVYLLTDGVIYWYFGKSYVQELEKLKSYDRHDPAVGTRADAFLMSLCNMMLLSLITLAVDGGYGVMFALFMFFSLWLKITDLYQYTRYSMKSGNGKSRFLPLFAFWTLFLIILSVVIRFKKIFISLFDSIWGGNVWIFFAVAALIICLMAVLVAVILDIRFKKSHLILPIIVTIACSCAAKFAPDFLQGSHMEFRTRVHMQDAGEILFNIENATEQNKFLQASLNDWILYEYQNIGNSITSFGEKGNGYFKLQPQSKLGAMWFAQTTDICISRYIIAEHGGLLPWLFVLAFAVMLLTALLTPSTCRWSRMLTVQVALLLAVQSLMILLANTRAFIFFGQDFPLISITSRLSSLYFFILFAVAACSAIIGKNKHYFEVERRKDGYEMYQKIKEKNSALSFNMIFFFIISAILLSPLFIDKNLNTGKNKEKKVDVQINEYSLDFDGVAYYKDGVYDVDTLLTVVNKELETYINPAFVEYQKKNGIMPLKRNMSDYVTELFADSLMISANNICSDYTQRMLASYVRSGSKNNSIKNIICIRNVRTYEYKKRASGFKVIPRDTLEFVTSLDYFKYELPKKAKNVWHGDVVERMSEVMPDSACTYVTNNWAAAYIPARFTANNKETQIICATSSRPLKLVGSDAIISIKRDSLNVANVSSDDFIMVGNRTITDTPLQKYHYFARNILLNGKSTYIYPNGHKMLWAKEIVASKLRLEKKDGAYEEAALSKDLVLTIDSKLNNSLYDAYVAATKDFKVDDVARDRAVVVADGNGNIKAMVDYRADSKYRINPNDFERIAELSDSLYMNREKGRILESRFFGNFSRNPLRRGPGSTQKPIVWSAVTSMYNIGWWDKMRLSPIWPINENNVTPTQDGKYFVFKKYAGNPIESQFRSICSDEGNGNSPVTLQSYMYKSSNYYNSLLAYIGSFRSSDLNQDGFLKSHTSKDGSSLFYNVKFPSKPIRKKNQSEAEYLKEMNKYANDYINTFPGVQYGEGKVMSFNKFLQADMALDTEALLPKGLRDNFGLMPKTSNENLYSCFNMSVRNMNVTTNGATKNMISNRQLNEYMVRSVAIGSNSVWTVTPLKMAEMFGRLISLNKNYELSYEVSEKEDYELFNFDDSWKNGYNSYKPVRAELLKGMSMVFGGNGTAHHVYNGIPKVIGRDLSGEQVKLDIDTGDGKKSFYIYGKTGTINGFWGPENKEDHLLATIITDREVSSCSAKELEDMKFYVIYQVDYANTSGRWISVDREILETVLNSQAFKDYMGIK